MADYDGPEITGIYVRVNIPGVGWCAADIADPAVPKDQLDEIVAGWSAEMKASGFEILLRDLRATAADAN